MSGEKIIEKLESNWNSYMEFVSHIKHDDVRNGLTNLAKEVKDRLAAAPASTRLEFVGAYPGGLVEHSLNVLKLANGLNKVFSANIDTDSLILVSLFHDIGKLGNDVEDYYTEQTSSWHKDKGIMYEINPKMNKIHTSQRSLWWLNSYNVPMSEEEIAAVSGLSHMGQMFSNEVYDSPMLTLVLQTAVRAACAKGKGKTDVL